MWAAGQQTATGQGGHHQADQHHVQWFDLIGIAEPDDGHAGVVCSVNRYECCTLNCPVRFRA